MRFFLKYINGYHNDGLFQMILIKCVKQFLKIYTKCKNSGKILMIFILDQMNSSLVVCLKPSFRE